MNIARLLNTDLIKLRMDTPRVLESDDSDAEDEEPSQRLIREQRRAVLDELVTLLERSERICNRTKLLNEFEHRERKATTAIGHGIAIPHIRTLQATELIIGVALAPDGYDFDAPDGEPVKMFFAMAAPTYDDNLYLRVFKALAEVLRFDYFRDRLLEAEQEYDIIRAFQEME
jgi:mannitol/fructose-specific phosphotransferase system IIA component (Ntr-type)